MTATFIAFCVGFLAGVVGAAWGESRRIAAARNAAYEAGVFAEARRESERRSASGTKAAATRRRNRTSVVDAPVDMGEGAGS